jgi:ribosomal protein S14
LIVDTPMARLRLCRSCLRQTAMFYDVRSFL